MRIVVVGGGIAGAGAAYRAVRQGAEVVVVDAAAPGHATAAGAGIVCPWTATDPDPDWYRLAEAATRDYPALIAELAEAGQTGLGYRRTGVLRLAAEADLAAVRDRITARCAGVPEAGAVSVLTGAAARELFPPLRGDLPAVHIEGAARVDGRLLRAALLRATGAQVRTGAAELLTSGGRVRGVLVDGERIEADAVVAAPGAWAPELLRPLGIEVAVSPQRGQIVHLGLSGVDTSGWAVVQPPSRHYLLAFDDSRVVVGATRETGSGFDHRVTAAGLAEVLTEALAVAPGLAVATHLETRIGFRPAGPDARPLLGPVPGVDGLVLLTGLGASGLTLGPHTGALAADLALGLPTPDLTAYAPLRTSAG